MECERDIGSTKNGQIIHTWLNKAFKDADVKWKLPTLHGGSFQNTLTVPLNLRILAQFLGIFMQ